MPFISIENEVSAWNLIAEAVNKTLDGYPTTLEKDIETAEYLEIVPNPKIDTINQKKCVEFIMIEKVVLNVLLFCTNKVRELSLLSMD